MKSVACLIIVASILGCLVMLAVEAADKEYEILTERNAKHQAQWRTE